MRKRRARVEQLKAEQRHDPDWADHPGADWEDPVYTAWIESLTDEDIEEVADKLVALSEKVCRKH